MRTYKLAHFSIILLFTHTYIARVQPI